MNLILVEPGEVDPDGDVVLRDRRARHVIDVHRAQIGDVLRVGIVGGLCGEGTVSAITMETVALRTRVHLPPPPPAHIDLLLALPRPKVLKRLIPAATSLGVKRIVLVNAARVERSYFSSPTLEPNELRSLMMLGLEQACDTVLPDILVRNRFRPFVEDELPALWPEPTVGFVAHPHSPPLPSLRDEVGPASRVVVAIGPEGGWVPFEVDLLAAGGFHVFSLGPRILRVDTAVTAVVSQIDLFRSLAGTAKASH